MSCFTSSLRTIKLAPGNNSACMSAVYSCAFRKIVKLLLQNKNALTKNNTTPPTTECRRAAAAAAAVLVVVAAAAVGVFLRFVAFVLSLRPPL